MNPTVGAGGMNIPESHLNTSKEGPKAFKKTSMMTISRGAATECKDNSRVWIESCSGIEASHFRTNR